MQFQQDGMSEKKAFDRANLDENVPRSPKVKYAGLGFSSTQFHEPYAVEKLSIS